jgi:hypothetical protein
VNIEKVTYKIVRDSINNGEMSDFILKMMISYLSDEQRSAIVDEVLNEQRSILFQKGDAIWFDPKDNMYDLKGIIEADKMIDALVMTKHGYILGTVVNDCSYKDECNPYATEYKILIDFSKWTKVVENKEIRVKRCNIIKKWEPLKDLE